MTAPSSKPVSSSGAGLPNEVTNELPRDVIREVTSWDQASQDAVERIRAASAEADHHDPLDEAARLLLKHHGLSGSRLWLVADSGFALLHDGALELAVAPTARGCGFGTTLAATAAPYTSTAWSHGDHPAAAKLAARHGFARARELWVMRRPASESLPVAASRTDVNVRGFQPGDEPELLRVNAAAFASHPEQGAMDAANLADRMAEPWFDPAGLLVAVEGDRMLGFHWTKRATPQTGEVYVVGIDPAAQGRGLGKLLTLAGLRYLAAAGVYQVDLYVESDNHAARALYEGLGFIHEAADTHVQYHR
jgi:mycothiol synthase